MQYSRFDRHEIFEMSDTSFVLDIINSLSKRDHSDVVNMLFGLFDGYWYDDLLYKLYTTTDVPGDTLLKLETLLEKVDKCLAA